MGCRGLIGTTMKALSASLARQQNGNPHGLAIKLKRDAVPTTHAATRGRGAAHAPCTPHALLSPRHKGHKESIIQRRASSLILSSVRHDDIPSLTRHHMGRRSSFLPSFLPPQTRPPTPAHPSPPTLSPSLQITVQPMGDLARGPAPPRRRRLLVIMMLLLLPIAAAYDKGLHRHAVAKLKPSRPQRPSKKGANNTGPVPPPPPFPGTPALFVGTPSTVNASDLPTPKPDPTPPDPAIRAVKRAWRVSRGVVWWLKNSSDAHPPPKQQLPTGTTSTIDIAGEMAPAGERLGGNHDNENDNVGDLERRRRLTKEKRRLALTAKQNFAGIPNIQGCVFWYKGLGRQHTHVSPFTHSHPHHDSYTPPDTIGTIGPNHYVQAVNTLYAVYDRFTGAALVTPRAINTLFAGSGLWCASRNDGTSCCGTVPPGAPRLTPSPFSFLFFFPLSSRRPHGEL